MTMLDPSHERDDALRALAGERFCTQHRKWYLRELRECDDCRASSLDVFLKNVYTAALIKEAVDP